MMRVHDKLERAHHRMWCDHAFYVGATSENAAHLAELERIPGTAGVKIFMGASTGSLLVARDHWHTATLLSTGKVLVAGGVGSPATYLSSAELYDPVAGTYSSTGSMNVSREAHTATAIAGGKVLVVGGSGFGYLSSAELYY